MKKVCLEIMQIHFGLQKQSIEVGQTKMRKTMSSCTTIQSVEYGMPPRMVCRHQRQNTLQAVGGNCDLALIVNRNNRPPHSLLPDLVEEFQRRVHQCLCTHVKEGRGGGVFVRWSSKILQNLVAVTQQYHLAIAVASSYRPIPLP